MTDLSDADEITAIAAAFLGEHWRERVERAGTDQELREGFDDVFFRGLKPQPEGAIDVDALRSRLERRLGGDRVRVHADGRWARVELGGITAATAKDELGAIVEIARNIGSHAKLVRLEIDERQPAETYRAGGVPAVRIHCEVPLENVLFIGKPPSGPRPPIEHGRLVDDAERLRLDVVTCPSCKAEHAVFYNAKAHAQDSEDVPFTCLACSRHSCTAWGIPELSSYRIDLVERLPPKLARLQRRDARRRAAWQKGSSSHRDGLDGLRMALWATIVLPAALLLLAWRSPDFDNPVFRGARTLATIACALHGVGVAAFTRSMSRWPPTWLAYTFAAVFALMIPVLVALWG